MKAFDYSCGTAVRIFDVNSKDGDDVTTKFTDYSQKANRDLIERSYGSTPFLKGVSAAAKDFFASYSDNFGCSSKAVATQEDNVTGKDALSLPPIFQFLENYVNV